MSDGDSAEAPPGGWHQQDIQAEIRKRGSTLSELSRTHDLDRGTLQAVFYKRYPKGQRIVAAFIGRSLHELWPHWYDEQNELRPLQGRPHLGDRSKPGRAA